jgi:hypothetical protein
MEAGATSSHEYLSSMPLNSHLCLVCLLHFRIFAPSHHSKGECDSCGVVVKKGIRLFVLNGIFLHLFFKHLLCLPVIAENNHVDDENEAVEFINCKIANSTAFKIIVHENDVEEDCSALQDSNSFYEFRCVHLNGVTFVC